ncbi:MAG: isopentenyl phosphate kinase [Candidatus Micrarchaeia archaeon]
MRELVFVKLGGSLITDKTKPFTPRMEIIKRVAREIHEAREEGNLKLIVGHGGGSFPHVPAKKYEVHKGVVSPETYRGISEVQDAASRLNRIVVECLIEAGENAVSVQPSACVLTRNGRIVHFDIKPLQRMLSHNLLPVPYGDVVVDLERGCSILSTEMIFDYLARKLKPKRIILVGITNGVLANPRASSPQKIPEITPGNFSKVKNSLGGSAGIDVTGGMLHKVEILLGLARIGIESRVICGLIEGNLKEALLGKPSGTLIHK